MILTLWDALAGMDAERKNELFGKNAGNLGILWVSALSTDRRLSATAGRLVRFVKHSVSVSSPAAGRIEEVAMHRKECGKAWGKGCP